MMRVLGVAAAGAVALIALPTAAGASSETPNAGEAASAVDADRITSFLSQPSLFGFNLGAVLWLSIALIAVVVGLVAVRRSRHRSSAAGRIPDHSVADAAFPSLG